MSNARAFRRRRELGPHGRSDAIQTAWIPAWASTDEGALEEAKKRTHDDLIAMLGDRRRSGVSWAIHEGDAAEKALGALWKDAAPEMGDYLREIRRHLRQYGGFFVVAMAKGVR